MQDSQFMIEYAFPIRRISVYLSLMITSVQHTMQGICERTEYVKNVIFKHKACLHETYLLYTRRRAADWLQFFRVFIQDFILLFAFNDVTYSCYFSKITSVHDNIISWILFSEKFSVNSSCNFQGNAKNIRRNQYK